MFSIVFRKKSKIIKDEVVVQAVVSQTAALIHDLHHQMDLRFRELSAQVKEVELSLNQMETKLLTKDLKDKQAYGLLHYKLHEAKHATLSDEVKDLERELDSRSKAKGQ